MDKNNIFSDIRGEISDFVNNWIEVVPGYLFNQYQTIKRCHLYLNSRFEDSTQYHNRDKIFYNIVKYRRDIAAKFLNIDTKDIRLWELNPKSKWSTFFLEKELKLWMKQNKIGKLLNDIAVEAPSYGTVVLKKTKKGAQMIDLRRLFNDPTVESIQKSRFITIKHYLTSSELRAKVKDGWDSKKIEQIISDRDQAIRQSNAPESYEYNAMTNVIRSSPYFEIYERFGEVPESYITDKVNDNKTIRSLFIIYNPFDIIKDNTSGEYRGENGAVLFKSRWTGEYPFKDYHYAKTPGRYLGIGVVEDLFPAQERRNELVNQKRISMEISSIHLFQTQGKTVVNNILTDMQNGDIIETGPDGGLQVIPTEERNLSAFTSEEQDYDNQADRMSFATSQAGGDPLPATTPATNAVIMQNNTTSLFGFKRENLAIFLQEFFSDFVLPQCIKDLSAEHVLRFVGTPEELNQLDNGYVDVLVRNKIMTEVLNGGEVPTQEGMQLLKENLILTLKKEGAARFVKIKERMYDDVDFEFDIMVVNEQENVATVAQNMFQVLTAISQNPQLLNDPVAKALLFEYAQRIGISPIKLEVADGERMQQQAQQQSQLPQQIPNGGQQEVGQGAVNNAKVQ